MKQHITKEQLFEFVERKSKEDYNKEKYTQLYRLTCPKRVHEETFTIGRMIEIIDKTKKDWVIGPSCIVDSERDINGDKMFIDGYICDITGIDGLNDNFHKELVDALWDAVKHILDDANWRTLND